MALSHLEDFNREVRQETGTATLLNSARAHAANDLGDFARADLAHLDARAIQPAHRLAQPAGLDALFLVG